MPIPYSRFSGVLCILGTGASATLSARSLRVSPDRLFSLEQGVIAPPEREEDEVHLEPPSQTTRRAELLEKLPQHAPSKHAGQAAHGASAGHAAHTSAGAPEGGKGSLRRR